MVTAALPLGAAADGRAQLVGVWRFVGESDTKDDGSPAQELAPPPREGLLIYTPDGFMSVNLMPKGRHWRGESAAPEELVETVVHGSAYSGRYEVDSTARTVTHLTEVSVDPDYAGRPLVRTYSIVGDRLLLSGTFHFKGETIHFTITWQRIS